MARDRLFAESLQGRVRRGAAKTVTGVHDTQAVQDVAMVHDNHAVQDVGVAVAVLEKVANIQHFMQFAQSMG